MFRKRSALQRLRLAALLAAGLAILSARSAAARPSRRTYRLGGMVRLDARPFPARDEEVHVDAVLIPGVAPGELRVRLMGDELDCELIAAIREESALSFAPGQRCRVQLRGGEAEGNIEARLLAGSGQVHEEVLSLELAFAVSGAVRLRAGGSLESLGGWFAVPGQGSEIPVRGEVRGRAQGRRDRSRAADE